MSISGSARQRLPRSQVLFYAVGHVLNDMTAACWFSYLLIYLVRAVGLSGAQAGAVLFAGQLADACATPVVGIASDAGRGCPTVGLGRRKAWNLGGVVVVAVNFVLVFGALAGGGGGSTLAKSALLGVFAALFNFGWAAVQVSHMALVPELTSDEGERVLLNSARYAFTILSNCLVFLVMLALLGSSVGTDDVRYADPKLYRELAFIVLGVGLACSAVFLVGTREPLPLPTPAKAATRGGVVAGEGEAGVGEGAKWGGQGGAGEEGAWASPEANLVGGGEGEGGVSHASERRGSGAVDAWYDVATWRDWLRVPDFWRIMAVYALVRLSVNVSQVYISFFVTETLLMPPAALAVTPLLAYMAQLAATLATRRIAVSLGRRRSIFVGATLIAVACGALAAVPSGPASNAVYPCVMVLGFGLALSMVVSVSMEADLVGSRVSSAAFVYGACSLADKLASGVFVLGIQIMGDEDFPLGSPNRGLFIRFVNSAVPAAAAIAAAVVASTIRFPKHAPATAINGAPATATKSVLTRGVSQMFFAEANDADGGEGASAPLLLSAPKLSPSQQRVLQLDAMPSY